MRDWEVDVMACAAQVACVYSLLSLILSHACSKVIQRSLRTDVIPGPLPTCPSYRYCAQCA